MKGPACLLILSLFFSGCTSLDQVRAMNRGKLVQLSLGLSKSEVLQIMGIETIKAGGDRITNPYRTETLKGEDRRIYEVLFYYTDFKKRDGAVSDDELTPLVIKDGKLIGWGWNFLNDHVAKYQH